MLELVARLLSRDSGPVILIKSADANARVLGPAEAWSMQCGRGW